MSPLSSPRGERGGGGPPREQRKSRLVTASSPVARDHWGIFELIIKESGDEGSNEKGRKSSHFPSDHSPLALYARSHHPSLALLACSRVPQSPLSPGKACEGGRLVTMQGSMLL